MLKGAHPCPYIYPTLWWYNCVGSSALCSTHSNNVSNYVMLTPGIIAMTSWCAIREHCINKRKTNFILKIIDTLNCMRLVKCVCDRCSLFLQQKHPPTTHMVDTTHTSANSTEFYPHFNTARANLLHIFSLAHTQTSWQHVVINQIMININILCGG